MAIVVNDTATITGSDNELFAPLVDLIDMQPPEHLGWWIDAVVVLRRAFPGIEIPLDDRRDHAPFMAGIRVRLILTTIRDRGLADEAFLTRGVLSELDAAIAALVDGAEDDERARYVAFADVWDRERRARLSDGVIAEWRRRRAKRGW